MRWRVGRAGAVGGTSAHTCAVPPTLCWATALLGMACAVKPQTHGIRDFVSLTNCKEPALYPSVLHMQFQTKLACMLLETAAWRR